MMKSNAYLKEQNDRFSVKRNKAEIFCRLLNESGKLTIKLFILLLITIGVGSKLD